MVPSSITNDEKLAGFTSHHTLPTSHSCPLHLTSHPSHISQLSPVHALSDVIHHLSAAQQWTSQTGTSGTRQPHAVKVETESGVLSASRVNAYSLVVLLTSHGGWAFTHTHMQTHACTHTDTVGTGAHTTRGRSKSTVIKFQ